MQSKLSIPYQSDDFPTPGLNNIAGNLNVSWDDILWSAITIGRPNLHYVFQHGDASYHEALFRLSMVRMALEQYGPAARRLRRTFAFKALDPTEKGAINYFLGMVFCKVFASRILATPWLLHLDVFKDQLNAGILTGRSRPDLIGQSVTGDWHAFECKGRMSRPDEKVKAKAKDQACRLVSVDGTNCTLNVGAITFFASDALNFYWRDPEPDASGEIKLQSDSIDWGEYYKLVTALIKRPEGDVETENGVRIFKTEFDFSIRIAEEIADQLLRGHWSSARNALDNKNIDFKSRGLKADGTSIKAGPQWSIRRQEGFRGFESA